MTDGHSPQGESDATTILAAALIALAIVLLVLLARGPEGEQRSAVPAPTAAAGLMVGA